MQDLSAQWPQQSATALLEGLVEEAAAQELKSFDVYGIGGPVPALEKMVGAALGKAAAAFVTSGTAANQACVRAALATRPSGRVALHPTSHLLHLDCLRGPEQGTPAALAAAVDANLLGLAPVFFGAFERAATSDDVESLLNADATAPGGPRVRVLVLELPQRMNGGATPPWEQLLRIRRACDASGIHLHIDGARLWEVAPRYRAEAGVDLAQVAAIGDSVYVSFYKGLGASVGAMILGNSDFAAAARGVAKTLGALPHANAPAALSCVRQWRLLAGNGSGARDVGGAEALERVGDWDHPSAVSPYGGCATRVGR